MNKNIYTNPLKINRHSNCKQTLLHNRPTACRIVIMFLLLIMLMYLSSSQSSLSRCCQMEEHEYIHRSYNTLISVSSLQVPELTSANVLHSCERQCQHSRDTTSKHWVGLRVTSSALHVCLRWLARFAIRVNYLVTLSFQESQVWIPGLYQNDDDSSKKGRFTTHSQSCSQHVG